MRDHDPEAPILPRVAAGDSTAVRACLDRYGPLVWGMVRRWFGSGPEGEDAVQDVFVQLWSTADRFDPSIASERAWVATIARRRLIDRRRRGRGGIEVQELADDVVAAPRVGPSRMSSREDSGHALRALEELVPEQRDLIVLSVLEGLSHNQIAKTTGLRLGTVKTRLRTGLGRLRERLEGRREVVS